MSATTVYRIKTADHRAAASKVDAGFYVDKRDRQTRKVRWEQLDEDPRLRRRRPRPRRRRAGPDSHRARHLPRHASSPKCSPAAPIVPKTLIFAKDDSHADDIVRICREVFGKGNDFCQKITYQHRFIASSKEAASRRHEVEVTGNALSRPRNSRAFRNSYSRASPSPWT